MKTLKEKRESLGFTQKEIAAKVGISRRQYLRVENEEALPNVKVAIRIAKVLNTTVESLYGD